MVGAAVTRTWEGREGGKEGRRERARERGRERELYESQFPKALSRHTLTGVLL